MFVTLSTMVSPEGPPAHWDGADAADVRSEALDVVLDALEWRLADTRWQAVEQILTAMNASLAAGDVPALAAATAELELASPLRMTRIGDTPVVPAAQPVRVLLTKLVYSLGGAPSGSGDPASGTGTDGDGTTGR